MRKMKAQREGEMNNFTTPIYNPLLLLFVVVVVVVVVGPENRDYGRRDPSRWPCDTIYPKKFALTWLTSGGRSRTEATDSTFITGSTALHWALAVIFSFLHLYIVGRTPRMGDHHVARLLPTYRTTYIRINKYTSLHASSRIRTHDPSLCLWPCGYCDGLCLICIIFT
jgi:hypothetical protein